MQTPDSVFAAITPDHRAMPAGLLTPGAKASQHLRKIIQVAKSRLGKETVSTLEAVQVSMHQDGSYTTLAPDGWTATRNSSGKIMLIASPAGDQILYRYDEQGTFIERLEIPAPPKSTR